MIRFTLQEIAAFDAVVRNGSFQAAAKALNRSHAAVFAAVAKLEEGIGLALFDRGGYRAVLTEAGQSFHFRSQHLLAEASALRIHAEQLGAGEETHLRVVIGDTCPPALGLSLISDFFGRTPSTRLDLHFETITGPWERLMDGDADLILHWVDISDPHIEWIELGTVEMVPVVAPRFLPFDVSDGAVTPGQLRPFTQCIIRDTARGPNKPDFHIIEGARSCTVPDQLMKKEVICRGLAWGHLPDFLIRDELRSGSLLSIRGEHFPGVQEKIVAARRTDRPHGPVAERLWKHILDARDYAIRSMA